MFPKVIKPALFLAAISMVGCDNQGTISNVTYGPDAPPGPNTPNDPQGPNDPNDPQGPNNPPPTVVVSKKARLKIKTGQQYAEGLSTGLYLLPTEVCQELGQYDCVNDVHRIVLGGVEPYRTGIITPLEDSAVTAPIAVQRVALSACTQRAATDFADPDQARIFKNLAVTDGRLTDVHAAEVETSIDLLYRRLLARRALPAEVEHLRGLYSEMAAVGAPDRAQQWAAVSCFAVATTLESLFY